MNKLGSAGRKVALVTGGNRGIGLAACKGLVEQQYDVFMGCRDLDDGNIVVNRENLENVTPLLLDVTDPASVNRAIASIGESKGYLDVLINNAGISRGVRDKPSVEDLEQAQYTLEVNFFGVWRVIQASVPLMLGRSGAHIINVSSGHGSSTKVDSNNIAYRSSKAALNTLTQGFALELAGHDIRVNCMTPGWVRTKLGGLAAPRSPEEGAETILWLVKEDDAITGSGRFFKDREIFPW